MRHVNNSYGHANDMRLGEDGCKYIGNTLLQEWHFFFSIICIYKYSLRQVSHYHGICTNVHLWVDSNVVYTGHLSWQNFPNNNTGKSLIENKCFLININSFQWNVWNSWHSQYINDTRNWYLVNLNLINH